MTPLASRLSALLTLRLSALLTLLLGASGCALTSKADPVQVDYLRPTPCAPGPAGAGIGLDLGEVSAGEALERTLLVARSPNVLAEVEGWRWTEEPARYVARALGRALFEAAQGQPSFRRARDGQELARLSLELVRFELDAEARASLVLRATLSRGERVVFEETFAAQAPVGAATREAALEGEALTPAAGEALAAGFGAALQHLSEQVRERTLAALPTR